MCVTQSETEMGQDRAAHELLAVWSRICLWLLFSWAFCLSLSTLVSPAPFLKECLLYHWASTSSPRAQLCLQTPVKLARRVAVMWDLGKEAVILWFLLCAPCPCALAHTWPTILTENTFKADGFDWIIQQFAVLKWFYSLIIKSQCSS